MQAGTTSEIFRLPSPPFDLSSSRERVKPNKWGCDANSMIGYETAFSRYGDQAARTAFQASGAVLPVTLSLPNANWPYLIRCMSSMPTILIDARCNRLNPSIGPKRILIDR